MKPLPIVGLVFIILACDEKITEPHSECADPTGPHPISAKPTPQPCPADAKALIATALFGFAIEADSLNYEYNVYKNCPKEELDFLKDCDFDNKDAGCDGYRGGHAGWDVQTKSVVGEKSKNVVFCSLTSGEVTATDTTHGMIAVYNADEKKTVVYLHAREIFVDTETKKNVEVGTALGIQGNRTPRIARSDTTTAEHVHVEVQNGWSKLPSCGASELVDRPGIDPIVYLYKSVTNYLYESSLEVQ